MSKEHSQQWFLDRIGKRIYRNKTTCKCKCCARVFREGLIVDNEQHAFYLYSCEGEMDISYYEKEGIDKSIQVMATLLGVK